MGGPDSTEANRRIAHRVLEEIWGGGRIELIDELYAPGYVDHAPRGPEAEIVRGPQGLKEAVTLFRSAFPDLEYTVEETMAERDLTLARFSARGTLRGEFLGVAPTGREVRYTGTDINRITDGVIVESWVHYDALGLLEQVGLVEPVPGM